jgi:molybdate transport system substrate-binding protein
MTHRQLRLMMPLFLRATLSCFLLVSVNVTASPIRIAVASNFKQTLEAILPDFEQAHPEAEIQVITGSTGGLFAQIIHGAPFDIFLAADAERPRRLLKKDKALQVFHYATGLIVFWAPDSTVQVTESTLRSTKRPIAVANDKTAPYGAAAKQALTSLNILGKQFVTGSNVSQSYQFVDSGNAETGFVALSQVMNRIDQKEWWLVPSQHFEPIVQLGALLPNHHIDAAIFLEFLLSETTQEKIAARGYKDFLDTNTTLHLEHLN